MKYKIIATGSSGNALLINDQILIDCGVSYKKLTPYIKNLKLVLLTHIHSDHFKASTVRAIHNERPTVRFGCCEWMVKPLLDAGVDKKAIDVYTPKAKEPLGWECYSFESPGGMSVVTVAAVPLPHNVPNCGHVVIISSRGQRASLLYATDCSTLEHLSLLNLDYYFVEANHTQAEIEARIEAKLESGDFAYEVAAARNHLSREQAIAWLRQNVGEHSKCVLLHQHNEAGAGVEEQC